MLQPSRCRTRSFLWNFASPVKIIRNPNQDGSAVFSAWLGGFLTGELGLTPRIQTAENAAAWQSCVAWWEDYLAQ